MTMTDTLVSGALAVSDNSISSHTASEDLSDKAPQEPALRHTSLETPRLPPFRVLNITAEDEIAISTALPSAGDEELELGSTDFNDNTDHRRQSHEATEADVMPAVKSYSSTIDTLRLHLPHLVNVRESSRNENVRVTCYDYSTEAIVSIRDFWAKQASNDLHTVEGRSLREYLAMTPPDLVQLRLIVANDLSTDLIDCLGTSLSMSPEVYEEHLVNSGWQNGMDNDQQPDTWITRDMEKTHMSLRWYRPVKRAVERPCSATDRCEFLRSPAGRLDWTEKVSFTPSKIHEVEHVSTPATNILRQSWDMNTDTEVETSTGNFIAWEERATVWSKLCGGLRVAVVLLDPLPMIRDELTGPAEALQSLGVDSTRIQRPAKREAVNPSSAERKNTRSSTVFTPQAETRYDLSIKSLGRFLFRGPLRPRVPSRNDGSVTEGSEPFQSATDPESGVHGEERPQRRPVLSRSQTRSVVPNVFNRFFGRPQRKVGTEIKAYATMDRCMFKRLYLRGPALDYDFLMDNENVAYLAEHLHWTKSTAANLTEWLRQYDHLKTGTVTPTLPLTFLFAIIQNDTMNTLRHMTLALQDIGQLILDDALIQQRLLHWRLLLGRFGTELEQLDVSLRRFADFIDTFRSSLGSNDDDLDQCIPSVEKLLEEGVSEINSLRQRTNRSHKSLMANMSIVESKRGIAEAESVTKLTELAFFFIPLTFSAGIFSMQVEELNASRISIAAFFVLAIIITTASYALRLVIRSRTFVEFRKEAMKDIRENAGLTPASPIPTTIFVAWLWRRIGLLTVLTAVLAALLAALWTSHLARGIKVAITIVITVLYITIAVFNSFRTFWGSLYETRNQYWVRRSALDR